MARRKRSADARLSISKRFKEGLFLLGQTPSSIYALLGYETPATIYSIVAGSVLPDVTRLIALSSITTSSGYRINIDWLITGVGEKLIASEGEEAEADIIATELRRCSLEKRNAIVALLRQ